MNIIIEETLNVIKNEMEEWEERYDAYANEFIKNKDNIEELSKGFRECPALRFYISTSKIKNAKTSLTIDARYRGQSIATLTARQDGVTISTKDKVKTNHRDFGYDIELKNTDWKSKEAKIFRAFFNQKPKRNQNGKGNEEHSVEQLLLTEFLKSVKDKPIKRIQPVTICGYRYPMPTPIRASDHNEGPKYSKDGGGNIDILARTGLGKSTCLTVIEVKDENKKAEPPKNALKQAIKYAIFIRELLRSKKCGDKWYQILGFKGKVPKKLTIRVACAMPDNYVDTSFANKKYHIDDNDILECHYIYFKYEAEKEILSNFHTTLKQQ